MTSWEKAKDKDSVDYNAVDAISYTYINLDTSVVDIHSMSEFLEASIYSSNKSLHGSHTKQ